MAYASYMNGYGGPKWFYFRGPGGSVAEMASYEAAARRAAAERLNCEEDELICTEWQPVNVKYRIVK